MNPRLADIHAPVALINGGYHTLQFTIIGLVLALLPCKDRAELPCP